METFWEVQPIFVFRTSYFVLTMAGQCLRFGRWGVMLTIPGIILVWMIGLIFMPNSCKKEDNISNTFIGTWFLTTNTGFTRIDIKENGYFYFVVIRKNQKSTQYKGIFTEKKNDFTLISFQNDTLLYHKIIAQNEKKITLKSIRDNKIITFMKE